MLLNVLRDEVTVCSMTISDATEPVTLQRAVFDLLFGCESLAICWDLRDKDWILIDLRCTSATHVTSNWVCTELLNYKASWGSLLLNRHITAILLNKVLASRSRGQCLSSVSSRCMAIGAPLTWLRFGIAWATSLGIVAIDVDSSLALTCWVQVGLLLLLLLCIVLWNVVMIKNITRIWIGYIVVGVVACVAVHIVRVIISLVLTLTNLFICQALLLKLMRGERLGAVIARSGLATRFTTVSRTYASLVVDIWSGRYGSARHLLHTTVSWSWSDRGRNTVMVTTLMSATGWPLGESWAALSRLDRLLVGITFTHGSSLIDNMLLLLLLVVLMLILTV